MNERLMQFRVGVVILATVLITAILTQFVSTNRLIQNTYSVEVRFDKVPGVSEGTPVRKNGIHIGKVSDVRFADDDRAVIVTVSIENRYHLYKDEVCRATSPLLMGDASLDFVRSTDPHASHKRIEPGATLQGYVYSDPTRSLDDLQQGLSKTMTSVDTTSNEMQAVFQRIDRLLAANEERISKVITQTDETLALMQKTLTSTNDILGDPKLREQVKQTVAEMPEVLNSTRETMDRMGKSISSLDDNLRNLEGLTRPLGENGATLVQRIDSSTAKLDRVLDEFLHFTQDLNNPQGTVGQLMHDPELYQHISRTMRNVDELTRDLRPILDDARVFTDKIARHPSQLGVRGALQKDAGIK